MNSRCSCWHVSVPTDHGCLGTLLFSCFSNNFSVKVRNAPWRPGDVMHTRADINKAKEDLGYEPKVKFWEGLEKTVKWWGLK